MQLSPRQTDRIFFGIVGAWFVALTFVGFSQSFYLRIRPEPLPAHQVVHGVLSSAWVVLFLVQTLLIASRPRWHIRLGLSSVILLMAMIPAGFYVVLVKAAAGFKSVDEAGFNLTLLTLVVLFAAAGLAFRKRPVVHKRLMLFATLTLTVAAADRVSILLGLEEVRLFRKLLAVAPGIALVGYDAVLQRRTLLLSVSLLILVWLVLWFVVSDVLFMHPAGEALIQALTRLVA